MVVVAAEGVATAVVTVVVVAVLDGAVLDVVVVAAGVAVEASSVLDPISCAHSCVPCKATPVSWAPLCINDSCSPSPCKAGADWI